MWSLLFPKSFVERAPRACSDTPETLTRFAKKCCRLEGGMAFNVYPAVRYTVSQGLRAARARAPDSEAHSSHESDETLSLTALHTTGSTAPRGRLRCGCSELLRLLFTSSDFTHTHITHTSHSILASFACTSSTPPHTHPIAQFVPARTCRVQFMPRVEPCIMPGSP